MPLLAVDTVVWALAIVAALSVAGLLLIVIAPSKRVREEHPLSDDVESRLLLGEDPEEIAEDVDKEEAERAPVSELRRDE